MGRNAQGPVLLRLLPEEEVIGAASINDEVELVLGSQQGTLLMINPTLEIRKCQRGAIGQISIRFQNKSDFLIDLCVIKSNQLVSVLCRGSNNQRINTNLLKASIKTSVEKDKGLNIPDEIKEVFTTQTTYT